MSVKRTLAILLLLTLIAPAWGKDFEKGNEAFERVGSSAMLKKIRLLAEQGDAFYQYLFGAFYRHGIGVQPDYPKAAKWFRKAAEQGNALAQYYLGDMSAKGQGVMQDDAEAVKWLRKAAEQGNISAQSLLAHMYREGQGVPQDYVQAHKWESLATSQSPPGGGRDTLARNSDLIAQRMAPTQIGEAQQLARSGPGKRNSAVSTPLTRPAADRQRLAQTQPGSGTPGHERGAKDRKDVPNSRTAGWYFTGNLGISLIDDIETDSVVAGTPVNETDTFYVGNAVFGSVGYAFSEYLRVAGEIGYSQNSFEKAEGTFGGAPFSFPVEGNSNVLSIMANAFFDIPVDKIVPYVGAGMGFAKVTTTDVFLRGMPLADQEDNTFAWQIAAGIGYRVSSTLVVGLDYRFFAADPDIGPVIGGGSVDVRRHTISVGARTSF